MKKVLEQITIRKARFQDCYAISALLKPIPAMDNRSPESLIPQVDYFFVAVDAATEEVVGAAGYQIWHNEFETPMAKLIAFVVHEAYRRKGIGTQLAQACMKAIKSRGITYVIANSTVEAASGLYKPLGFHETGRFIEWPGQPEF